MEDKRKKAVERLKEVARENDQYRPRAVKRLADLARGQTKNNSRR